MRFRSPAVVQLHTGRTSYVPSMWYTLIKTGFRDAMAFNSMGNGVSRRGPSLLDFSSALTAR